MHSKKRVYFLGALLICVLALSYIYRANKKDDFNTEPHLQEGGEVGLSISDQSGAFLYDEELLEISDGSATLTVWLEHTKAQAEEYGLIVLQNFIQTPFYKDGNNIDHIFEFKAESYSENKLQIDVPINEETLELSVIIVRKPNEIIEDFQLETALQLEQVFVKRYIIKDQSNYNKEDLLTTAEPDKVIKDDVDLDLFISSQSVDLSSFSSINEDDNFYMHVGNNLSSEESIDYIIVGFKDWVQYSFIDNIESLYIPEIDSGERRVFELITPSVEKKENIQFIAFPYPYERWDDRFYTKAQGSFRIVAVPHINK